MCKKRFVVKKHDKSDGYSKYNSKWYCPSCLKKYVLGHEKIAKKGKTRTTKKRRKA